MADDHQPAAEGPQVVPQPGHRVGVQVVGGLVEQQRLGTAEQDPGQLYPPPLAAGQGAQRLPEHFLRQAEAGGERRRLGLGRVPAEHGEAFLQVPVPAHGGIPLAGIRIGHRDLGLAHAGHQRIQSARRQHPVHRQRLEVADAGVLRQVPDGSAVADLARGGQSLPGQHPREGRLAGPVPADQADLVASRDLEGSGLKQQPGTRAQL